MPPVPTALSEDISRLISAAKRRQNDLVEFQVPRLRSCKGPLSLQQNLAAELREDIDSLERQVEALDVTVEDQRGEKSRVELRRIVDELQEDLAQLRRDSRAALLTSKRAIDSQSKSQRDELLASSAVAEKRNTNEKITDDALMKANDDVTDALRRTIGLMQGELERSVLSTQMLDASTASLRATSTTHDTLTNLMGTSKQLITALEKSDWIDRVLIISGFVFFILVVLFIVKERILDRSLRVALWWTRFLPDFSADKALLNMEKGSSMLPSATVSLSVAVVATSSSTSISDTFTTTLTPPKGVDIAGAGPSSMLEKLYSDVTYSASSEPLSAATTPDKRTLQEPHVPDEL
ncbi:hypothetical protein D9615_005882 [Tricholomella constricta]|uniref:Sec20 C-terminal domain-containing protein n=1 Tax=Tricholomella constricta TaxID=117010 RepID=A0A8H5H942_9AGAR|nr:hypothetical protein D9615_005882 [Tricholomella constricta]